MSVRRSIGEEKESNRNKGYANIALYYIISLSMCALTIFSEYCYSAHLKCLISFPFFQLSIKKEKYFILFY
jgi:hypothetical protein